MKLLAVRWVVIMALLFILTACGGGGDDESTAIRMPDDPVTEQPQPELPDVTEPDPEPELPDVATLPTPRAVDGGTYYRGDRETVVSYLQDVLGSEPVRRFSGTPVLRVREGTPAQEIEQIQLAVADLNAFLPEANEIHFETVVQVAAAAGPEAGVIVVSIGEPCPNAQVCQGGGLATAYDGLAAVGEAAATFGVDVLLLDRLSTHEFFCLGDVECSNAKFRSLVVHELLHALGLRGHVRDSVASAINEYGLRGVQPSDEDGLAALYTLDEGDSVIDLGDWAIVNHALEGYIRDPFSPDSRITFGVRLNNGRPEAFVEGPPAPALTGYRRCQLGGRAARHDAGSGDRRGGCPPDRRPGGHDRAG